MQPRLLYRRHPVYKRINRASTIKAETSSLLHYLENSKAFNPAELALLRDRHADPRKKLLLVAPKNAALVNDIARIESSLPPSEKARILDAGFKATAEITGIPVEFLKEMHSEVNWRPLTMQQLLAGAPQPEIAKRLPEHGLPREKKFWALVAKRLSHNLLIQGASLRVFYQVLPFMRETLEAARPGLTDKYIGFAATLQLINHLYEGAFPQGMAASAGKTRLRISAERKFAASVQGINFPSLFNEIVKATYEALLHEGMPTERELGKNKTAFQRLTSGPVLEFEEHKVAPQASLKMNQHLARIASDNFQPLKRTLERSGYEGISKPFAVSMLYKAFSRLSPRTTAYFFARAVQGKFSKADETRLLKRLLQNLRGE